MLLLRGESIAHDRQLAKCQKRESELTDLIAYYAKVEEVETYTSAAKSRWRCPLTPGTLGGLDRILDGVQEILLVSAKASVSSRHSFISYRYKRGYKVNTKTVEKKKQII